jgi:5'-nucleotidase
VFVKVNRISIAAVVAMSAGALIASSAIVNTASAAEGNVTLTLLHNNDGESALLPQTVTVNGTALGTGSAAAFKTVLDRERARAKAIRGNSVFATYAGDSFLASNILICSEPSNPTSSAPVWDAIAQQKMGYDVHALGNHEFDYGPAFLARYIKAYRSPAGVVDQPFISGNLNFAPSTALSPLLAKGGVVDTTTVTNQKVVGSSAIFTDPQTGNKFGIVSAITPTLQSISSPLPVQVISSSDLDALAAQLQKQINAFEKQRINRIILVSHMQSISIDTSLIQRLRGVDVAVAGGGDDLLANPNIPNGVQLLPGANAPVGQYPTMVTSRNSVSVPVVTTGGNYQYLGRLDVTFDKAGKVVTYNQKTSFPRRVVIKSDASAALGVTDAVVPDPQIIKDVQTPLQTGCLAGQAVPFASSQIVFNTQRGSATTAGVRTVETNGGNLVADAFMNSYGQRAAAAGLPANSATNRVVAATNGGGIRINSLPDTGIAGPISRAMTFSLLPFDNRLTVVQDLTATQLKSIFERSCSIGTSGGGQFLQTAGMKVTCSRSGTAQVTSTPVGSATAGTVTTEGTRVRSIILDDGTAIVQNGVPVATAPVVDVVTNSFTASGGDNYAAFDSAPLKVNFGISYEQTLFDYLNTFPSVSGLPTVPSSDARYAPTVNSRFFWVS